MLASAYGDAIRPRLAATRKSWHQLRRCGPKCEQIAKAMVRSFQRNDNHAPNYANELLVAPFLNAYGLMLTRPKESELGGHPLLPDFLLEHASGRMLVDVLCVSEGLPVVFPWPSTTELLESGLPDDGTYYYIGFTREVRYRTIARKRLLALLAQCRDGCSASGKFQMRLEGEFAGVTVIADMRSGIGSTLVDYAEGPFSYRPSSLSRAIVKKHDKYKAMVDQGYADHILCVAVSLWPLHDGDFAVIRRVLREEAPRPFQPRRGATDFRRLAGCVLVMGTLANPRDPEVATFWNPGVPRPPDWPIRFADS